MQLVRLKYLASNILQALESLTEALKEKGLEVETIDIEF